TSNPADRTRLSTASRIEMSSSTTKTIALDSGTGVSTDISKSKSKSKLKGCLGNSRQSFNLVKSMINHAMQLRIYERQRFLKPHALLLSFAALITNSCASFHLVPGTGLPRLAYAVRHASPNREEISLAQKRLQNFLQRADAHERELLGQN